MLTDRMASLSIGSQRDARDYLVHGASSRLAFSTNVLMPERHLRQSGHCTVEPTTETCSVQTSARNSKGGDESDAQVFDSCGASMSGEESLLRSARGKGTGSRPSSSSLADRNVEHAPLSRRLDTLVATSDRCKDNAGITDLDNLTYIPLSQRLKARFGSKDKKTSTSSSISSSSWPQSTGSFSDTGAEWAERAVPVEGKRQTPASDRDARSASCCTVDQSAINHMLASLAVKPVPNRAGTSAQRCSSSGERWVSGESCSGSGERYRSSCERCGGSGERYCVSGERYSSSSERYRSSGERYRSSGEKYSVSGESCSGSGERCSGSGERCSGSGERCSGSGERCSGSGERCSGSGERYCVSGERYRSSCERCSGSGERCSGSGESQSKPLVRGSSHGSAAAIPVGSKSASSRELQLPEVTTAAHSTTPEQRAADPGVRVLQSSDQKAVCENVVARKRIAKEKMTKSGVQLRQSSDQKVVCENVVARKRIAKEKMTKSGVQLRQSSDQNVVCENDVATKLMTKKKTTNCGKRTEGRACSQTAKIAALLSDLLEDWSDADGDESWVIEKPSSSSTTVSGCGLGSALARLSSQPQTCSVPAPLTLGSVSSCPAWLPTGKCADTGECANTGECADSGECADTDEHAGTDQCADTDEHTDTGADTDENADTNECVATNEHADADEHADTGECADTDEHADTDECVHIDSCAHTDEHACTSEHACINDCTHTDEHAYFDECAQHESSFLSSAADTQHSRCVRQQDLDESHSNVSFVSDGHFTLHHTLFTSMEESDVSQNASVSRESSPRPSHSLALAASRCSDMEGEPRPLTAALSGAAGSYVPVMSRIQALGACECQAGELVLLDSVSSKMAEESFVLGGGSSETVIRFAPPMGGYSLSAYTSSSGAGQPSQTFSASRGQPSPTDSLLASPGQPSQTHSLPASRGQPSQTHSLLASRGQPSQTHSLSASHGQPSQTHSLSASRGQPSQTNSLSASFVNCSQLDSSVRKSLVADGPTQWESSHNDSLLPLSQRLQLKRSNSKGVGGLTNL